MVIIGPSPTHVERVQPNKRMQRTGQQRCFAPLVLFRLRVSLWAVSQEFGMALNHLGELRTEEVTG